MKKLLSLCFILILQACSTTRKVSIDFVRQDTVALENYLQEAKVDFDEKDLAVLNNVNAFAVFNDKERISVLRPISLIKKVSGLRIILRGRVADR